jgi:hypothetical protein
MSDIRIPVAPFEPSRSYAYRAARYELLPRIAEIAKRFGQEPFLLRDIWKPMLAETYTPEQLDIRIKKAQSDATEKMSNILGSYIPFLAENLKVFENLGGGMFRNIPLEEELAEADAVATDVEANDAGTIYAYSFPSIMKEGSKFPIKVGLTTTGDAQARVTQQCRAACCFEFPRNFDDEGSAAGRSGRRRDSFDARGARLEAPRSRS